MVTPTGRWIDAAERPIDTDNIRVLTIKSATRLLRTDIRAKGSTW